MFSRLKSQFKQLQKKPWDLEDDGADAVISRWEAYDHCSIFLPQESLFIKDPRVDPLYQPRKVPVPEMLPTGVPHDWMKFPTNVLPLEYSPVHSQSNDLEKLPLCWYGVHAVDNVIKFIVSMGFEVRNEPQELGWLNFARWFYQRTGLKVDIRHPLGKKSLPILTFMSNRELDIVRKDVLKEILELLDAMHYPPEVTPAWFLDKTDLSRKKKEAGDTFVFRVVPSRIHV